MSTLAFASQPSRTDTILPLTKPQPSFNAQVNVNNGSGAFQGDLLVPVLADYDHVLYSGLEAQYSTYQDSSSLLGLGMGYRQLANQKQILGGYLFISHNLTPDKNELWVANPGFERLGNIWDFRANGYIPISSKQWSTNEGFAEDFGNYDYVAFRGHEMWDRWTKDIEEAGTGGDAEIGYHVPKIKGLSIYTGPYYYHFRYTHDMYGGEARIKYDLNKHMSLLVVDSYDNENKNIFTLALRITIDNDSSNNQGLVERLSEPVEHYIASRNQGTASPIIKQHYVSDELSMEEDDIWFFDSDNSISKRRGQSNKADGTYEYPYNSLDQATIDSIDAKQKNTKLYLRPGTYALDPSAQGQLTIKNGMSIYGRSSDFVRPTNGNNRALLQGGLTLLGSNTLDSLRLANNTGTQTTGITVEGTSSNHRKNITLNNIQIGATNTNDGYAQGIYMNYVDNISIKNSSVTAFQQNSTDDARGISVNNSTLTLDNSSIVATNQAVSAAVAGSSALGIYIDKSTLNILNGSTITATATSSGAQTAAVYGIYGVSNNKIVIDNSGINATATTQNGASVKAYGIDVSKNSSITLQGAKPSVTASASASGNSNITTLAYGISADDNSTINVNSSGASIKTTASSPGASTIASYGIELLTSSTANISGGTIDASSGSCQASAFAAYINSGSTLNISNTTLTASANEAAAGIFANSSTVKANSNTFNITSNGLHGFDGLGYGIYAVSSTVTQAKNTFKRTAPMGGDIGNF